MRDVIKLRIHLGSVARIGVDVTDGDDATEEIEIFFSVHVPDVLHVAVIERQGLGVVGADSRKNILLLLADDFAFSHGDPLNLSSRPRTAVYTISSWRRHKSASRIHDASCQIKTCATTLLASARSQLSCRYKTQLRRVPVRAARRGSCLSI